jgi:hypothetical protein
MPATTSASRSSSTAKLPPFVERRPPWRPDLGPEWTSSAVARLRYVARDKSWTLQWRDRNGRWHRYADANPTADVTVLLNEIDADPTGIFWG